MKTHKTVDEYIIKHANWKDVLIALRKIMLFSGLEETIKWGAPVYTFNGKNIVGLGAFKSYAGIWFFQGALLKDKQNKLTNAQEGKTKALRQWRFQSINEIDESLVKGYVIEAIENQEKGKEIKPSKNKPLIIPHELKEAFKTKPEVQQSFNELSLGKQREYAEYISEAKREATKLKRLEKIIPMIAAKQGLYDKYKN